MRNRTLAAPAAARNFATAAARSLPTAVLAIVALMFSALVPAGAVAFPAPSRSAQRVVSASSLPTLSSFPGARPVLEAGPIYSQSDTTLLQGYGFDRPDGSCAPRGWTAEDRTGVVFGHVDDAVVNLPALTGIAGTPVIPNQPLQTPLTGLTGIAVDDSGHVIVASDVTREMYAVYPGQNVIRLYAPALPGSARPLCVARDPVDGSLVVGADGALFRLAPGGGTPLLIAGIGGSAPTQLTIDAAGNAYFADPVTRRVKMFRRSDSQIIPIAGTGGSGPVGDGGPALNAVFEDPRSVALSADQGTLYIGDKVGAAIRSVNLTTGIISQVVDLVPAGTRPSSLAVIGPDLYYSTDTVVEGTGAIARHAVAPVVVAGLRSSPYSTVAASGVATHFRFDRIACISPDGAGGLWFTDSSLELVYHLRVDGTIEVVAGNAIGISMGARAFLFGANAASAPNEVANWVNPQGYGNGWGQRLTSPAFSYATHPSAVFSFDAALELPFPALRAVNLQNEFLLVQGLRANGTWAKLTMRYTTLLQHSLNADALHGGGVIHGEVHLGTDGNEAVGLAPSTQLRFLLQTNTIDSDEDGRNSSERGAAVIDNLRVLDGALDVIGPADFESGGTAGWTPSALNGAYADTNEVIPRQVPPPASDVALKTGADFSDPSCAWTFLSPGDTLANGVYSRLTSPWIRLNGSSTSFLLGLSGKLNTIEQKRYLNLSLRLKRIGDPRPTFWSPCNFLLNSGTSGGDLAAPAVVGRILRPADFEGLVMGPNGPEFSKPGSTLATFDSLQLVVSVEDRAEYAGLTFVPPFNVLRTTRLPYLDDLRFYELLVDDDHDGVLNADDNCPAASAAGEDADRNGCLDAGFTMRHVETWPLEARPIHFALSQNGVPAIPGSADLAAVRAGFASWQAVSGASIPLLEDPVTSQTRANPVDGVNLVTFEDDQEFPLGAIAVATTTSLTRRGTFDDRIVLPGEIVDSDIVFNPRLQYSLPGITPPGQSFDLQSIATHEVGHFLGISHSGVEIATMFPILQTGTGAASLEDDDRAAVASAYPGATFGSNFGSITGQVLRGRNSAPVPGALVVARAIVGGSPAAAVASDYTREDGTYALRRLPPGSYAVRVTPLDGSIPGLVPSSISERLLSFAETNFQPEWFGGPESSGDDPNTITPVVVTNGNATVGIDVITNIDSTPPTVTSTIPGPSATGVGITPAIVVTFSERVEASTLKDAFKLHLAGGSGTLGGRGELLSSGITFVFTPADPLDFDTEYEIELTTALTDREANPLTTTFTSRFRTLIQPEIAITGVLPAAGTRGTFVTVTGFGFDVSPGYNGSSIRNGVIFSQTDATTDTTRAVTETPNSIVVRVPDNAITGPLHAVVHRPNTDAVASNDFTFTVIEDRDVEVPSPDGAAIPVPFRPTDVALAPDGLTAFAVGQEGAALINLSPLRPNPRVPAPLDIVGGRHLAITADGARVFVTRPDFGEVVEINGDATTAGFGTIVKHIPVAGAPDGITLDDARSLAYVNDSQGSRIFALDVSPASPTYGLTVRELRVKDGVLGGGLAVESNNDRIFATDELRGVLDVSLADDTTSAVRLAAPAGAGLAHHPSDGLVYATGIDATANQILYAPTYNSPEFVPGTLAIGGNPRDVVVSPVGPTILVANGGLNVIQVLAPTVTTPNLVGQVPTGSNPVAIGQSLDGAVVATANFGGSSVSIFRVGAGTAALTRVTPEFARPGDLVSIVTSSNTWLSGANAELSSQLTPIGHISGKAVSFRVPAGAQQDVLLGVEQAGSRTLTLPFRVIDPIEGFQPVVTDLVAGPNPYFCLVDSTTGRMDRLTISPDGRFLAVDRLGSGICGNRMDLYRLHAEGREIYAERLLDAINWGSGDGDDSFVFTYDSKKVWGTNTDFGVREIDVDPDSPGFGTVNVFGTLEAATARAIAADPMGRFMVVSGEASGGQNSIQYWDLATHTLAPGEVNYGEYILSLAISPDGKYLVAGGTGRAYFIDLDTRTEAERSPLHGTARIIQLAIATDGRRAMGLFADGNLAVWNLDPLAGTVGSELYFGAPVPGVQWSQLTAAPDGNGILAGTLNTNDLYKFEPAALTVPGAIPPPMDLRNIGQPINALARTPDGRGLWVAKYQASGFRFTGDLRLVSFSDATRLSLLSGGGQSALVSQKLPLPVRVQVTSASGAPQAGVVVRFELAELTDGTMDGLSGVQILHRVTDAHGEAGVEWRMPPVPGAHFMGVSAPGVQTAGIPVTAEALLSDELAAPELVVLGPNDGAVGINATTPMLARFSQRMDSASVAVRFHLAADGSPVAGSFDLEDDGRLVLFRPTQPLPFLAHCTITMDAGALDREGQTLVAGGSSAFTVQDEPDLHLTSLYPPAGPAGAALTIDGRGFSLIPAQNSVVVGGAPAAVNSATGQSLVVTVPFTAVSGDVTVTVGGTPSNPVRFTVLAPGGGVGGVLGDLSSAKGIRDIEVHPDGRHTYITNPGANNVTVLQIYEARTIGDIPVGVKPQGVAIRPDGLFGYVANTNSDNVSVIGTDSAAVATYNQVVETIPVGKEPVDIEVSPQGPRIVVLCQGDSTLHIIDGNLENLTRNQVTSTVNTGSRGTQVVITPDGTTAWIATETGATGFDIRIGSETFGQVTSTVNTGSRGTQIVVTPDGGLLFLLAANDSLYVVDIRPGSSSFGQVTTTVNTGSRGTQVVVSPDGALVYVSIGDGGVVLVFSLQVSSGGAGHSTIPGPVVTLTLVDTIPVGSNPTDLSFTPDGSRLLVVNQDSGTITVIGTPPPPPPPPAVVIEFEVSPNHLDLRKLNKWVTGKLEPLAPYTAAQIDPASVRLNGLVAPDPDEEPDLSGNGHELKLKFRRSALGLILQPGDRVPVTVTGVMAGHAFVGYDSVKVKQGKIKKPKKNDALWPGQIYPVEYEVDPDDLVQHVAVLHSLDRGESWQLDLDHQPHTGIVQWTVPDVATDSALVAVVLVEDELDPLGSVIGVLGMSDYFSIGGILAIEPAPAEFSLAAIRPNPARSAAHVRFGLPVASDVSVEVFDLQGRKVRTLTNGRQAAGWHDLEWHGELEQGGRGRAGLYFVRLRAGGHELRRSMVWLE